VKKLIVIYIYIKKNGGLNKKEKEKYVFWIVKIDTTQEIIEPKNLSCKKKIF
jgi:hypothetical protein